MKEKSGMIKAAAFGLLLSMASAGLLRADDTSANISIGKALTNLKIGGDMRIRQENFWKASPGQRDRSRQRFRFRLGIQPEIRNFKIVFRMASGTGEQVSTNQSFDDFSSQKAIWIDQAFVQWKAFEWMNLKTTLSAGRMQNPLWRVYSSDLVWDDDFNPEGLAEQIEWNAHERLGLFVNAMQMVLDEDSSDTRDQHLWAFQLGANAKIGNETKFSVAGALLDMDHEMQNTFSQNAIQEGNSRFNGANVSTPTLFFTMAHVTGEIKTKVLGIPVALQGDYVKNIADQSTPILDARTNTVLNSTPTTETAGYQAGIIIGKASDDNTWEGAYFFKWSEANATFADMADSDFGDGGTNRRGHILWIAYNPYSFVQLKAKLFVTEVIRPNLPPGSDNINRAQFDISFKF